MRKLQEWFGRAVHWLEENPAPLSRYVQLFFAILSLRLMLEFFSNHRLFRLDEVIHYGLWFTAIVLTFLSLLQLFSGQQMEKVAKLVVVCFSLALSAPLIDLITTGPGGTRMGYLQINSVNDALWAYVTVGGSSLLRGATLGIRIEIVLLVIAAMNYIYTKRGRLLPALLGAWAIYTALFLSGTLPFLMVNAFRHFHIPFAAEDYSNNLLLLGVNLMWLLWVMWRLRPVAVGQALRAAPWGLLLAGISLFIVGFLLGIIENGGLWQLNATTFFWFPLLLGLFLCVAALAGRGELNSPAAKGFPAENLILLLMLLIGIAISGRILFSVMLLWGLMFLFYQPPLRLKDWPLVRSVLFALMLISVMLLGFVIAGRPMVGLRGQFLLNCGGVLCLLHWLWGKGWGEGRSLMQEGLAARFVHSLLCAGAGAILALLIMLELNSTGNAKVLAPIFTGVFVGLAAGVESRGALFLSLASIVFSLFTAL